MKNLFTLLLSIFIVMSIASSCESRTEIQKTTEIKLAVTYTNGDVDTLTTKWTAAIGDSVMCYLSSGEHQACLCVTSIGEFGRTTLACGVRKFEEISRK